MRLRFPAPGRPLNWVLRHQLMSGAVLGLTLAALFIWMVLTLGDTTPAPSPAQLKSLEDGQVTRAEYEAAVTAVLECLVAEGVRVSDPVAGGVDDAELRYQFGFLDDSAQEQEVLRIHDRCYARHLVGVDDLWVSQLWPAREAELLNCARKALGEGAEGLSAEEVVESALSGGADGRLRPCLRPEAVPDLEPSR